MNCCDQSSYIVDLSMFLFPEIILRMVVGPFLGLLRWLDRDSERFVTDDEGAAGAIGASKADIDEQSVLPGGIVGFSFNWAQLDC